MSDAVIPATSAADHVARFPELLAQEVTGRRLELQVAAKVLALALRDALQKVEAAEAELRGAALFLEDIRCQRR